MTYCCWANDGDALLVCHLDNLPGLGFRDALGYDGDGVDLRREMSRRGWKDTRPPKYLRKMVCVCVAFFTCGYCMVSMVLSKAERSEAKLMSTSTPGCFFMASPMFLYTGTRISL